MVFASFSSKLNAVGEEERVVVIGAHATLAHAMGSKSMSGGTSRVTLGEAARKRGEERGLGETVLERCGGGERWPGSTRR